MGNALFYITMALSFAGSYFIAALILKRVFKATITHKQLLGFTLMFMTGFVAISAAIVTLTYKAVPFGR